MTPNMQVTNELIAHIFNPDPILRQTTAWAIYRLDRACYEEVGKRLKSSIKKEMDKVLKNKSLLSASTEVAGLFMDRILFLKRTLLLSHLPSYVLSDIAETMGTVLFRKGELIIKAGDQGNIPVYLIASGKAKSLHQYSYQETTFEEGDLIGENLILTTDASPVEITAQQDVWVYAIEKEMLYRIISYYPQTGHVYAQIASRILPDESLLSEEILLNT
jgi:hypothetical protein